MLTALLIALVCVLTLISAMQHVRRQAELELARAVWRIAMEYIAEEECEMPHEFAACFLAGNTLALRQKFPGFQPFLNRRKAELLEGAE